MSTKQKSQRRGMSQLIMVGKKVNPWDESSNNGWEKNHSFPHTYLYM